MILLPVIPEKVLVVFLVYICAASCLVCFKGIK